MLSVFGRPFHNRHSGPRIQYGAGFEPESRDRGPDRRAMSSIHDIGHDISPAVRPSAVPTLVIAGVRSGVGKTTIATGIMAALTQRGYRVQPFKAGPDYIDPSYHEGACGMPCRNLDTWLIPHEGVVELFGRAVGGRSLAVVEGVMGLFDGHSGTRDDGSTAELAKLLDVPVILVLDASKVARSVAAEVLGYQQFDPQVRIAGVVLNGIAGPSHLEFCKPQVEATTGLPVLGYMPYREDLRQPERHLGLIPTVEGTVVREWYRRLAAQIEETIDLDRMLSIAADTRTPEVAPTLYPTEPRPKRAAIAVAMDKAFSFYYQDSLDLLESWGADLMPFSPLEDSHLPRGAGGIYIGGGFPEMYVKELAENRGMIASIREAARQGIPIYAECGGLMYLGKGLTDFEGTLHSMAGLIPVSSSMPASRLVLGYREVEAMTEGPLLRRGQRVRGHEFHWSVQEGAPSDRDAAYSVLNQDGRLEGFRSGSVWASYIHLHLGSDPSLAPRFIEVCAAT